MAGVNMVLVVLAVGVVAVLFRPTWLVIRYAVTAVHEFGHVVVAVLAGGRVPRVRLWVDTSGLTTWRAQETGRLRSWCIAVAGHGTPPLVGAACGVALATGHSDWALIGLTILVAVVTIAIRNPWGVVVCLALAGICYVGFRFGPSAANAIAAGACAILCLGAVRAVAEELSTNHPGGTSDTQVAARALRLPAAFWGLGLFLWAVACTGYAAWRIAAAV